LEINVIWFVSRYLQRRISGETYYATNLLLFTHSWVKLARPEKAPVTSDKMWLPLRYLQERAVRKTQGIINAKSNPLLSLTDVSDW
jgi:hypothetical protein